MPPSTGSSARAVGALVLAVGLWGVTPVATRFLVAGDAPRIEPGALLALRFGLSALVLLPFLLRGGVRHWTGRDGCLAIAAGLLGVVGYNVPVTLGQVHVSAGTAALVIATEPVWILLLWSARRRQWPTVPACLGAVLGLAGVSVLMGQGTAGSWGGASLVLAGAVCWSIYCVLVAGLIRRRGALAVTAATVCVGCLPLLLVKGGELASVARGLDAAGLGSVLLLSLGSTVVATALWNHGVGRFPGPGSGNFLYGVPLVGVLAGHVALGEVLSGRSAVAAALIVAGVAIAPVKLGQPGGRS